MSMAKELFANGVITFPLFSPDEIAAISAEFDRQLAANPLLIDTPATRAAYTAKPAMDSFGALGDPYSFHMPIRKIIDAALHRWIDANLKNYCFRDRFFLHRDRAMVRPRGTTISGESWHTDNPPSVLAIMTTDENGQRTVESHEDDITLGGWVSLSGANAFRCCPKTHELRRKKDLNGFVPFTKEESDRFTQESVTISVPPGHAILFYQNIVHCINPGRVSVRTTRTFVGVSFTNAERTGFYRDLSRRLHNFSAMQLPSGQEPFMYEAMHLVFWRERIESYSSNFIDAVCETYVPSAKKKRRYNEDEPIDMRPRRFIRKQLGDLTAYVPPEKLPPPYTPEERAMFFPSLFTPNEVIDIE